jgi:hypothetical protein
VNTRKPSYLAKRVSWWIGIAVGLAAGIIQIAFALPSQPPLLRAA